MIPYTHKSLFFIQEHKGRRPMHGGVGNTDIERVLMDSGFRPILFPCQDQFSIKAKLSRFAHLIALLIRIPSNAIITFQFPLYARMHKLFLRLASYKKTLKVICIIADIDGLKSGDKKLLRAERKNLLNFHYFIIHNNAMRQWLLDFIERPTTEEIEFFDFFAKPFEGQRKKSFEIVFAGNLSKSLFLEKLDQLMNRSKRIRMNVYGEGVTENMKRQATIRYLGVFEPALMPDIVEGSFGLVWDGDGSFSSDDHLGHYMQYISHHKLSLYIISGLPIIVYANAGTAELVTKYQIGITVNSLAEIEDKIDSLDQFAYRQMQENLGPLAEKISSGGCLTAALEKILQETS